jgi:hypothetical protein
MCVLLRPAERLLKVCTRKLRANDEGIETKG